LASAKLKRDALGIQDRAILNKGEVFSLFSNTKMLMEVHSEMLEVALSPSPLLLLSIANFLFKGFGTIEKE